jgi:hypothetical protein
MAESIIRAMDITAIIRDVHAEIRRLEQARALLAGPTKRGLGKPVGAPQRRKMSAAGRARIAAAQKARWAKAKKAAK